MSEWQSFVLYSFGTFLRCKLTSPPCKCSCRQCWGPECRGQAVKAAWRLVRGQAVIPGGWCCGTCARPDQSYSCSAITKSSTSGQQHLSCWKCTHRGSVPSDECQQCQGLTKLKREWREERQWGVREGAWQRQKPEGPVHVRKASSAEVGCEKG